MSGAAQQQGAHGSFATLAQHLTALGPDYDAIIGAIAADVESDLDSERLCMVGAIREIKRDALKTALQQLFAAGLSSDEIGLRYREITSKQDQLQREADAELTLR